MLLKNLRPGICKKFTGHFDNQKFMLHLRKTGKVKPATPYDLQQLADRIGGALGLPDLFAKRRTADIVAARTIFNYMAFYGLAVRCGDISRFSGWSYSTIYYGVRGFRESLQYDFRLRAAWEKCETLAKEYGIG